MRVIIKTILACFFLGIIVTPAQAITYSFGEMPDPFSDGVCEKNEIISYGSYIYSYDSKYDGVYFPQTENYWLWSCPTSGFVSYPWGFEDISDEEKEKISSFLAANYSPTGEEMSFKQERKLAEEIFRVRKMDDEFWIWFYRVLGYWAETTDNDREKALEYRAKALPLIEQAIPGFEPGPDLIQHLYLAGEYHRQLGNGEEMESYFSNAQSLEWKDEEGGNQVGLAYFNELIENSKSLGLGVLRFEVSED